jgi:Cysteine-rich secretory protein family
MKWNIVCLAASIGLTLPMQAEAKSDCALMQQLAQEHSNDMARRESLDHRGFSERAARGARAENVAMGNKTKGATMAQWQASPRHAHNMGLPGCKAVAYAVGRSGRYYWTMEIGQSPGEQRTGRRGTRLIQYPYPTW